MIRLFSAIGMSQYTSRKAFDAFLTKLLQEEPVDKTKFSGQRYMVRGQHHVELYHDMGPFQLIVRGQMTGTYIRAFAVMPAIKEKRGYRLIDCELAESEEDMIYLMGQEQSSLEPICLCLSEVYRFYQSPMLRRRRTLDVPCYGLSVEGKVLLGIERSEEDEQLIREDEQWRRQHLERMMKGDAQAAEEIRESEARAEEEIEERLQQEDVYSIFDTFLYPADGADHFYTMLGDIEHVEKLMNSETEEWVYYLELNVMGQTLRIAINPRDLVGEPRPGRRFMGRAFFQGRLDPAALILENQSMFY